MELEWILVIIIIILALLLYRWIIQRKEAIDNVLQRTDEELLDMSFNLRMNGENLFQRHDYHWWLTGFDVGVFSNPHNLAMGVMLIFPNSNMKNAFLGG